jgi:hypothetical protein
MRRQTRSARAHEDIARRVVADQIIELELDRIEDLFARPSLDPFDGPPRHLAAGIEELGAMLLTLRRLPDNVTVRLVLPPAALAMHPATDVEAAFHSRAVLLGARSWRQAMAVRSMGRSQTPLGIVIGLVGGFAAYGFAYLALQANADAAKAALLALAALALTLAWIVGWVTVEAAILDWRLDARTAGAYDLLARAPVELVPSPHVSSPPAPTP